MRKNDTWKERTFYRKVYMLFLAAFWLFALLLDIAAGREFQVRVSKHQIQAFEADQMTGDLTAGRVVRQRWKNRVFCLNQAGVLASDYAKEISGNLRLELWNADNGTLLAERTVAPQEIGLNEYLYVDVRQETESLYGVNLELAVYSQNGEPERSATVWYQSGQTLEDGVFMIDQTQVPGSLCIVTSGTDPVWTGSHYWQLMAGACLLCSVFFLVCMWLRKSGRREVLFSTMLAVKKYGFLMEQLVSRDFKVRYKRSVLGVFWSFLNPLLTMVVQYIVFSQLFRGGIDNVALYILSGTVVFNFFTEAVGQSLGSVIGNASLITKVYVPKYIYPVSKVLSSTINFVISMIPLFIVMLVTGENVTRAMLMLPFLMVCVIVFSIGIGMLLAASMVFFRDTQFLWGIFSMLWMYMTPLFYPESLIAEHFSGVFDGNPMYYYVGFIRSITMDGVSPEPRMYVACVLFALGSLVIGGIVFKKTQNKFILYI